MIIRQTLRRPTVQDFNYALLMRMFFIASGFLLRVVLARILGADELGVYYYAVAWVDVLLIFSVFGINRLLVREISAARTNYDWAIVRGLLRFGTWVPLLLALLLTVLAAAGIMLTNNSEDSIIPAAAQAATLLALMMLPVQTLVRIRQGAMQAFAEVTKSQLPEYVVQPLLFWLILLGMLVLLPHQLSSLMAIGLYVSSVFVAFVYGEYLQRRSIPAKVLMTKPHYQIRAWLRGSLPFLFISGMFIISNRVDILMLGSLAGTEAVGIYSTAARIAGLVTLLLSTANTILAPRFVRLYNEGQMDVLQQLVTRSSQFIILGSAGMSIVLIVIGIPLLGIFGPEFVLGYTTLVILLAGQLVSAAAGSVGTLLTMTDHSEFTAIALFISTVLNVILNVILISSYGIEGAAIATLASTSVWNMMMLVFVRKKLKIMPSVLGRSWK